MTIKSTKNPNNRYNPDKTLGFLPPKSTHYTTEQLYKEVLASKQGNNK